MGMGRVKILSQLEDVFRVAIHNLYPEVEENTLSVDLVLPPNPEFGDYAVGCFPLAKRLRANPKKIASGLAAALARQPILDAAVAEGPYVNLRVNKQWFFSSLIRQILTEGSGYGTPGEHAGQSVMIEYSSPNTNKPQHLGHVRNNVLGMTVGNILEKTGRRVIRTNLVNDRGIHICKTMVAYGRWGNGETPDSLGMKGDHYVGDLYVRFEAEASRNETLLEEAQELLRRWEAGDREVVALWEKMNGWVYKGFDETYRRMGCTFDRIYRESDIWQLGRKIVLENLDKGVCTRNEKGDIVIDLENKGLGKRVLLRGDGTSIYITQDIGTAVTKFNDFGMDQSIYVVASEQNHYFEVLFEVLRRFGYEWADRCYHLSYGMVYLPEGKMKSREGTVVDADTLMDELTGLAKKEIRARERDIQGDEFETIGAEVGLGALKYYLLRVTPQRDITFDPAESVSFDGATGPYLQYTHARIASVARNAGYEGTEEPGYGALGNDEEMQVARLLSLFPETVEKAARGFNPAEISGYIYELAKAFNKFYHGHSILNVEDRSLSLGRFNLSLAVGIVLKEGLRILGIYAPERM